MVCFPVILNISAALTSALCNALVQSLLQGIFLAAIAGLIVIFTKKASPSLRYNLLISALFLFFAAFILTFIVQVEKPHSPAHFANILRINDSSPDTYQPALNTSGPGFIDVLTGYLNAHHETIVLIWFLVICAKSIELAAGLYGTYRLRHTNILEVGIFWKTRLQDLAGLLGIEKPVRILESSLAKVPMVIGHLRPVILIPVSLLTRLTIAEAEAVLIHELAHIYRRDFLVNIFQSLIEIVFFFNPAVLWVSQLIKTERENCCDDFAIARSNGRENYIRALVSCEEFTSAVPDFAMGFPGAKNSLLGRVRRMVSNRNHSLNLFEKTLLAVCVVISGFCISAFSSGKNRNHIAGAGTAGQSLKLSSIAITQPSVKTGRHRTATPDTTIQPALRKADRTDLSVKTRTARARIRVHAIGRELFQMGLVSDTNHLGIDLNDKELIVNGVKMSPKTHEIIFQQFGTKTGHPDSSAAEEETNHLIQNARTYDNTARQKAYADANKEIIADLMQDQLIADSSDISFVLSTTTFELNGKKMNADTFEKYKDKYVPKTGSEGWTTWTHSIHKHHPK